VLSSPVGQLCDLGEDPSGLSKRIVHHPQQTATVDLAEMKYVGRLSL
jgi:hypothetical protein